MIITYTLGTLFAISIIVGLFSVLFFKNANWKVMQRIMNWTLGSTVFFGVAFVGATVIQNQLEDKITLIKKDWVCIQTRQESIWTGKFFVSTTVCDNFKRLTK